MMKISKIQALSLAIATVTAGYSTGASASSLSYALNNGKTTGDVRLRYESVKQDNALDDASALTMRTRLGYTTGGYNGFSATLEFEDSRIVGGVDEFSVPQTSFNTGEASVVLDPEVTEVDQAFVKYSNGGFSGKYGRQVLTFDNHRFIGHVGWRQDRQTFDGLTLKYSPTKAVSLNYGYISKRNRIFAEAKDLQSKDHLFNASYNTAYGKLVGYAYLLETDNDTDNALDTFGVSFDGKTKIGGLGVLYRVEAASQKSEVGDSEFDTQYMLVEGGVNVSGITLKLGYEQLGSDSGDAGFATPLATLHKFNGWSDQFAASTPTAGLVDAYAVASTSVGPGKATLIWHEFSADESTATVDDLGSELNLVYSMKFGGAYNAGVKYAAYTAGDEAAGKVDTDKLWVWVGAKF